MLLSGSHAKILAACPGGKSRRFSLYYPTSLKFSKNILDIQQYAAGFLAYTRSVKWEECRYPAFGSLLM